MKNILASFTLEKKVIFFSLTALILMIAFTFLSYSNKLKIYAISNWISHSNNIKDKLSNLAAEINREAIDLHDFYYNNKEETRSEFLAHKKNLEVYLDKIQALTADNPSQQMNLKKLRSDIEGEDKLNDKRIMLNNKNDLLQIINHNNNYVTSIENQILNMNTTENNLLTLRLEKQKQSLDYAVFILIVRIFGEIILMTIFIILILKDIKKRKKVEEQLHQLNNQKDKLFSVISHDLRSPYTSLFGLTEYLETEADTLTKGEVKSIAKNLNIVVKNLFDTVDDLLQWSLIQLGKVTFVKNEVDINNIIENVKETLKLNSSRKEIQINYCPVPNLIFNTDERMLKSILRNLITNSIKFTNKGGQINITAELADNSLRVSVKDNGVGMSEEAIEKSLKPDEKYSTYGTEKEKGTGLGLIYCKDLVEKNNGSFQIKSEVNKGTEVSFTLCNVS